MHDRGEMNYGNPDMRTCLDELCVGLHGVSSSLECSVRLGRREFEKDGDFPEGRLAKDRHHGYEIAAGVEHFPLQQHNTGTSDTTVDPLHLCIYST